VDPAEFAGTQRGPRGPVSAVEAPLEADLDRHRAGLRACDHLTGARHVQGHRLLAEHRHPGIEALQDQVGMRAGRCRDHHAVQVPGVQLTDARGGLDVELVR
jgi:hypothetical protein